MVVKGSEPEIVVGDLVAKGTAAFAARSGAILTIGGLVAFVCVRAAHDTFYRHFDVRTDEVGLGYAEVLTAAGAPLLTALVGGTFVVLSLLTATRYMPDPLRRAWPWTRWAWLLLAGWSFYQPTRGLLSGDYDPVAYESVRSHVYAPLLVAVLAVSGAVAVAITDRRAVAALAWTALLGLATCFACAVWSGRAYAEEVEARGRLELADLTFFALGLSAEKSEVTGIESGDPIFGEGDSATYLGQADGRTVLLRYPAGSVPPVVVRLPSDSVLVVEHRT